MNEENLNKALNLYAQNVPDDSRLRHLESDVWQRIAGIKKEQPVGMFEGVLAFLLPMQHRFVPVICAALLGVVLSYGTLQVASAPYKAVEALNFKVFKPQVILLASIH